MPRTPSPQPQPTDNPAGPPEGTDHGHAGTPEPTAHTAPSTSPEQPLAQDLGTTTPTDTEDAPAGALTGTQAPVADLDNYLRLHHPADYSDDEHPATTALRVLTRLGARGDQGARCQEPYCNAPALHGGPHQWIHVEPATTRYR